MSNTYVYKMSFALKCLLNITRINRHDHHHRYSTYYKQTPQNWHFLYRLLLLGSSLPNKFRFYFKFLSHIDVANDYLNSCTPSIVLYSVRNVKKVFFFLSVSLLLSFGFLSYLIPTRRRSQNQSNPIQSFRFV